MLKLRMLYSPPGTTDAQFEFALADRIAYGHEQQHMGEMKAITNHLVPNQKVVQCADQIRPADIT